MDCSKNTEIYQASDDSENEEEAKADMSPEPDDFRQQLSTLTFGELKALKDKLGIRAYNQAIFGSVGSQRKKYKPSSYTRPSKSTPVEMSAKRPPAPIRQVVPFKRPERRDPRFDYHCGEFKKKEWEENYKFVREIRSKEKAVLKKQLGQEEDKEKSQKIKKVIQRITNQEREEQRKKEREEKERAEREAQAEQVKEGKKPFYLKKSVKKKLELAEKYEKLKKAGQLDKYLQKKRQKAAAQERRSLFQKQGKKSFK